MNAIDGAPRVAGLEPADYRVGFAARLDLLENLHGVVSKSQAHSAQPERLSATQSEREHRVKQRLHRIVLCNFEKDNHLLFSSCPDGVLHVPGVLDVRLFESDVWIDWYVAINRRSLIVADEDGLMVA